MGKKYKDPGLYIGDLCIVLDSQKTVLECNNIAGGFYTRILIMHVYYIIN